MEKTMEEFQQMVQERLTKVEEIQNWLKLSAVSLIFYTFTSESNHQLCLGVFSLALCVYSLVFPFNRPVRRTS